MSQGRRRGVPLSLTPTVWPLSRKFEARQFSLAERGGGQLRSGAGGPTGHPKKPVWTLHPANGPAPAPESPPGACAPRPKPCPLERGSRFPATRRKGVPFQAGLGGFRQPEHGWAQSQSLSETVTECYRRRKKVYLRYTFLLTCLVAKSIPFY